MASGQITVNIRNLTTEIKRIACTQTVTLVAASKARSVEEIDAAAGAGIRAFGENYLQEALPKIRSTQTAEVQWHFIGRIQANKCTSLAQHFDWVHTIDRRRVAQRLNAARATECFDTPLNVCVQVNIDRESQKAGVLPDDIQSIVSDIEDLPYLKLRGLMCIPETHEQAEFSRAAFRNLRQLFESTQVVDASCWDTLSMGMSNDYRIAIEEGATMVRLGTSIFGPRS